MNHSALYRCCFAGHSFIRDVSVIQRIMETATDLIENKGVTEFWVGNYGDFDHYATQAILSLKKSYPYLRLELMLPYLTEDIKQCESYYKNRYDTILLADMPLNTPAKFKIIKTNEYMINNRGYVITYIKHSWGGAAKTQAYARKQKNIQIYSIK